MSPKPKAQSPKPKAQSPKPKAQSPKPKAQSPKPKARSPKPPPPSKGFARSYTPVGPQWDHVCPPPPPLLAVGSAPPAVQCPRGGTGRTVPKLRCVPGGPTAVGSPEPPPSRCEAPAERRATCTGHRSRQRRDVLRASMSSLDGWARLPEAPSRPRPRRDRLRPFGCMAAVPSDVWVEGSGNW